MAEKKDETVEEPKAEETTETVEEKAEAPEKPAKSTDKKSDDDKKPRKRRSEKVGIVHSDKMEKTVTVRVNRMVKHQLYQKYMKKRKKFMAHDELGSSVGDRVKIVETRPTSAKKRWRVVEILQKAEK